MTSVLLVTEDRTGGGLERVIQAEAQARRAEAPLKFLTGRRVMGNGDLIKRVEATQAALHTRDKPDHIFFIMDVRNCWRVLGLIDPVPPHSAETIQPLLQLGRQKMTEKARLASAPQLWDGMKERVHCHLLLWERESILLPVADALDLGPPHDTIYSCSAAYEWVKKRAREHGRGHSKAIETLMCLQKIALDPEIRARAVRANPTLEAIVSEVASL